MKSYKITYMDMNLDIALVETLHNIGGDNDMKELVFKKQRFYGYPYAKIEQWNENIQEYVNITSDFVKAFRMEVKKTFNDIVKEF